MAERAQEQGGILVAVIDPAALFRELFARAADIPMTGVGIWCLDRSPTDRFVTCRAIHLLLMTIAMNADGPDFTRTCQRRYCRQGRARRGDIWKRILKEKLPLTVSA